jgi:hypothetical protein
MDEGISQAQARGRDGCDRFPHPFVSDRATISTFADPPSHNSNRTAHTTAPSKCLQDRVAACTSLSHRNPRLPRLPVLLRYRLQLARYSLFLLLKLNDANG